MQLHFVKMNPAENMTVFVMDPVPRQLQPLVAEKIMSYGHLFCEQVAFVEEVNVPSEPMGAMLRMQMMGGEFCGNAARCFGALMVHRSMPGITALDHGYSAKFEVSGLEQRIDVMIQPTEHAHTYFSRSMMPMPLNVEVLSLPDGSPAHRVALPGITHVIVDSTSYPCTSEYFHTIVQYLGLSDSDAVGIMFHKMYGDRHYIDPLVYIRATDTLIPERGCGSGTLALGVVLAYQKGTSITANIGQPGGDIQVHIEFEEIPRCGYIEGPVSIVAEGSLYI